MQRSHFGVVLLLPEETAAGDGGEASEDEDDSFRRLGKRFEARLGAGENLTTGESLTKLTTLGETLLNSGDRLSVHSDR